MLWCRGSAPNSGTGTKPSPRTSSGHQSSLPCSLQLLSSHSCCNSQIFSQNEEKPSKHFLHLIPEIPGANRTQKQTLVQIIANNRGFYGGLVHGAVKGFMLLSSISKGKGEGGGGKNQDYNHKTKQKKNPAPNRHHLTRRNSKPMKKPSPGTSPGHRQPRADSPGAGGGGAWAALAAPAGWRLPFISGFSCRFVFVLPRVLQAGHVPALHAAATEGQSC